MIGMRSKTLALAVVPLTLGTLLAVAACDRRESPPKQAAIPALVAPVLPAPTSALAAPPKPAPSLPSESTASGLTRTLIDKPETPSMPRTLVFGDSLIVRSHEQLEAQSKQLSVAAFPGTAPCDWLTSGMFTRTIEADRPDAVVLAFIGNAMTPCTNKATGTALVSEYRADVAKMVRLSRSQHVTRVILVRPPAKQNDPASQVFIDAYTRGQDTQLCEAGRAVSPAEHVSDGVHLTAAGSTAYAKAIVGCVLEP